MKDNRDLITQRLRDLIEDISFCRGNADELHNELLNLERVLGLPLTKPNPWGTIPDAEAAAMEAVQRAEARADKETSA